MASASPHQTLQVGKPIGDYRLLRFIGAGGMGEVYEAQHAIWGTRWAIKFLRREHVCRSDLIARFEQEARIASTLDSPHIIKVREFCVAEDATPYMVMELAEGRSLASLLAEHGRLTAARSIDLAHQVCVGLCVAHEQRIVHRDLKPENLYVCPLDGGAELLKILDFGIAKHLGPDGTGPTTATGSNLGTAHYMSPEQAQGATRAIDHRTDIYSLGVILYEMLSGQRPHQGESYNEILIRIVTQRPVPLDAICPGLAKELFQIVACAMQREPGARFQSAREFAYALARLRVSTGASTCLDLVLGPATRPRSPDMGTLASTEGESVCAAQLRSEKDPLARAPVSESPARSSSSRRMQIVLAAAVTATVAVSALWWHEAPRGRRAPEGLDRAGLAPLQASSGDARVARPAQDSARLTPAVAPNESRLALGTPTGTAGIEKPGALRTNPVLPTTRSRGAESPKVLSANAARKSPAIDDPLPPSPHAPGVSPVME